MWLVAEHVDFVRYAEVPKFHLQHGVMIFIVNQAGIVLEKDLGQDTEKLATEMSEYNPDKTWTHVD